MTEHYIQSYNGSSSLQKGGTGVSVQVPRRHLGLGGQRLKYSRCRRDSIHRKLGERRGGEAKKIEGARPRVRLSCFKEYIQNKSVRYRQLAGRF